MKKGFRPVIFCILLLSVSRSVFAFSCGGRIVSPGDTKLEVVTKCGEPAWKDTHEEQTMERLDETTKRKTTVIVDEWTYNFGPQSFLRILEFRNGKLADIRTGGYGYTDARDRAPVCDEQKVKLGDTKIDVLVHCGEPVWKEERKEEIIEQIDKDTRNKVTVTIEEWTYNLGPNRFMRIFTFRNGRLVDIRTGDYGK
ncbi:MAG TPA: DUF2845 domain-containing protein [Nitrospirota bacterium]|nr:DUF2845 domain-containing protein [Nitrospirota bacterium]